MLKFFFMQDVYFNMRASLSGPKTVPCENLNRASIHLPVFCIRISGSGCDYGFFVLFYVQK